MTPVNNMVPFNAESTKIQSPIHHPLNIVNSRASKDIISMCHIGTQTGTQQQSCPPIIAYTVKRITILVFCNRKPQPIRML
jgi:hypothetical protein